MEKTVTTLHYSAEKANEIQKLRDKYEAYGRISRRRKLPVEQRALIAGLTVGILAVAMAALGMLCMSTWHVVPLGIALYIAGIAGVCAAKPVHQHIMTDGEQEDDHE